MPQPFSLTGGNMKYSGVGGQAVMEGVMMKNEDRYAVAVRKPDHTIDVKVSTFKETIKNKKLRRLPFIRGVINFIESLILGMQTLMYSASFFEDDEDEKKKKEAMTQEERKAQEEKEKKQEKAMMGGTVAFSVVFALGLFFFLPYFQDLILHIHSRKSVECSERLVQQQNIRLVNQRTYQCNSLCHTSGKLSWIIIPKFFQANHLDHSLDFVFISL